MARQIRFFSTNFENVWQCDIDGNGKSETDEDVLLVLLTEMFAILLSECIVPLDGMLLLLLQKCEERNHYLLIQKKQ